MPEKDFAVGFTGIPQVGAQTKKPCYLISLDVGPTKKKAGRWFISIDKPVFEMNFISVKGVFSDQDEDEIAKTCYELVSNKDEIVDIMFPAHRVLSIRNLVFNANKHSTLSK
jgi:hypothetical protein